MEQNNATKWSVHGVHFGQSFCVEPLLTWIFTSCTSVARGDGLMLKVKYEYISPPAILQKEMHFSVFQQILV